MDHKKQLLLSDIYMYKQQGYKINGVINMETNIEEMENILHKIKIKKQKEFDNEMYEKMGYYFECVKKNYIEKKFPENIFNKCIKRYLSKCENVNINEIMKTKIDLDDIFFMDKCDNNDDKKYKLTQDEKHKFIAKIYLGNVLV